MLGERRECLHFVGEMGPPRAGGEGGDDDGKPGGEPDGRRKRARRSREPGLERLRLRLDRTDLSLNTVASPPSLVWNGLML